MLCSALPPTPPFTPRPPSLSTSDLHKPTIGVDFHFRRLEVNGTGVALQVRAPYIG